MPRHIQFFHSPVLISYDTDTYSSVILFLHSSVSLEINKNHVLSIASNRHKWHNTPLYNLFILIWWTTKVTPILYFSLYLHSSPYNFEFLSSRGGKYTSSPASLLPSSWIWVYLWKTSFMDMWSLRVPWLEMPCMLLPWDS